MIYDHMNEDHLMDDNHRNFTVKASATNNVINTSDCPCLESQGRTQEHLNRNNETMILTLMGFLVLFVCYGLYLLFK